METSGFVLVFRGRYRASFFRAMARAVDAGPGSGGETQLTLV